MKQSATDVNIFTIGRAHNNPLLDTQDYEVELEDGKTDRYFDNVIVENVYYQLDNEWHQTLVTSEIVDNRRDGIAVTKKNGLT